MKTYRNPLWPAFWASLLLALSTPLRAAEIPAAQFEGLDTMLRPEGYREWIFVGSTLGLEYSPKAEKQDAGNLEYKNVYLNPAAYRAFKQDGKFPEGTVLVLETASSETKNEPGLQGSFQKQYLSLSTAVKDSKRFKEDWAYFRFGGSSATIKDKAVPSPKEACYDCHRQKGEIDNVFTQFYPVLRAALKK